MQTADCQLQVLLIDHHGDLDLRGRDHQDVDAMLGQRLEHLARHTGMGAHPDPDNGDLGNAAVACDLASTDLRRYPAQYLFGTTLVTAVDGEGEIGGVILCHVDRKSTRLNSSHVRISYAVFCLKKKK